VYDDDRNEIELSDLSSGEKQMIIFLGETLLQEGNTHIFLADEPELSLHVEWQESLVDNIKALNPEAQIFFATHSPDIISTYDKCVFDMEDLP
jgi:predicted ATP-dependent endonuclease of OLD family